VTRGLQSEVSKPKAQTNLFPATNATLLPKLSVLQCNYDSLLSLEFFTISTFLSSLRHSNSYQCPIPPIPFYKSCFLFPSVSSHKGKRVIEKVRDREIEKKKKPVLSFISCLHQLSVILGIITINPFLYSGYM
jgi:hypothetical protein